jgi:hypothetical protein
VHRDAPAFLIRHIQPGLLSRLAANRHPRFVIVGTGRCGTAYLAQVLNDLEISCGHESIYTWKGIRRNRASLEGDASWLAVPYLPHLSGVVLHVVRHPLAVIGSFLGTGFYTRRRSPYVLFLRRYLDLDPDPMRAAMAHYVEWNRLCEPYASTRFQIERVRGTLVRVLELIGHRPPAELIEEVLARTPSSLNARHRFDLGWSDLPRGRLRDALVETAHRYGYE